MTRARDTADTQDNLGGAVAPFVAGKNKIINGDFAINQRNFSSTTSNEYTFDRWQAYAGANLTASNQTFTPGTSPVSGYEGKSFYRLVTASQNATTSLAFPQQRIESVRTFAGQTATVSFWAKAGSGTPKVYVELEQSFGTGGSPSANVVVAGSQVTLSTSWVRYSVTIAVPSISGKTIGTTNDGYLAFQIWISAGTDYNVRTGSLGAQNNTFDFWGVQIEAGSVATPFTTASGSIGGELALCQRYYWRAGGDTIFQPYGVGAAQATTIAQFSVQNPVPMRVAPTSIDFSTIAATDTVTAFSISAVTFANVGKYASTINTTTSGLTIFRPYVLVSNNSTSAYIGFSAEL
jgi:hypothetical protein